MFIYQVIPGPYFSVFSPNTGKYGPEITPYLDTFHAVILFSIFIRDSFSIFSKTKFASYADDSTLYLIERNIIDTTDKLELASNELVHWFSKNKMKSNSDMLHLLTSLTLS